MELGRGRPWWWLLNTGVPAATWGWTPEDTSGDCCAVYVAEEEADWGPCAHLWQTLQ